MALESDLQLQALLLNYNNSNKNNGGMGGDSFQQQHMQPACDMDPTILEFYPDHHFRHLTELAQKKGDYLQLNAKVTFEKMEILQKLPFTWDIGHSRSCSCSTQVEATLAT